MKQNGLNSSMKRFKALRSTLVKTVCLSGVALTVGSATAYAADYPEYDGLKLEKVALKGDHVNGDTLTLTYKDTEGKTIVKSTNASDDSTKVTTTSFLVTPNTSTGWHDQGDSTVCYLSESKCEVTVDKNGKKSKLISGDLKSQSHDHKYAKLLKGVSQLSKNIFKIVPHIGKDVESGDKVSLQAAFKLIGDEMIQLIVFMTNQQNALYIPGPGSTDFGRAEAEKWATEHGLNINDCLRPTRLPDGRETWIVLMNLRPANKMYSNTWAYTHHSDEVDVAAFQAWKAVIDEQETALQSTISLLKQLTKKTADVATLKK